MANSILTPYRINATPEKPPRRARRIDTKRATFASGLPLSVMALAFFLPAAQDCNGQVIAPCDEAMKSIGSFAWLAPTYLGAAMFAFSIAVALVTRRVSNVLPVIALVINALAAVGMTIASPKSWPFYIPVLLVSIPLLRMAQRREGFVRLSFLIDAFVFFSIPVVAINVELGGYWGAYAFIVGYVAFVTIRASHAVSMLRARYRMSNG